MVCCELLNTQTIPCLRHKAGNYPASLKRLDFLNNEINLINPTCEQYAGCWFTIYRFMIRDIQYVIEDHFEDA